jgi:hypothetical protein
MMMIIIITITKTTFLAEHIGNVEIQLHIFLASALERGVRSVSDSDLFYPREGPG